MKKVILISVLVLVLVLVGCENIDVSQLSDEDLERVSEKAVICNKPYIRVGMECCLDQNDNKICDKDESGQTSETIDLTPTEIVKAYTMKKDSDDMEEHLPNIEDSLNYLTGRIRENVEEHVRYLRELNKNFKEFYNDYWEKCIAIKSSGICQQLQKQNYNAFNQAFKGTIKINSLKEKENDGKNAVVNIEFEETLQTKITTVIKDYLLKKEGEEWKIYDCISENGTKCSDTSLEQQRQDFNEYLDKQKKNYEGRLEKVGSSGTVTVTTDSKKTEEDDSTPETLEITSGEATSNGLKFDVSLAQNGETVTYKDGYGETQELFAIEGMKILRFDATVESVGDSKSFSVSSFFVLDNEGNTYNGVCPLDYYRISCVNADGLSSMYSPIKGQKKSGLLTYQIPSDVDKAYLVYKFSKYDKKPRVLKFVFENI